MISNEVLEARAYLMYVRGQSIRELTAFVHKDGAVKAAAEIRNGSAPAAVLAELGSRTAPEDLFANAGDARLIVPESDEWPTDAFAELRASGTEPLGLWVRGDASLAELTREAVAVVGTRAATAYGSHVAADFGHGLARRGTTVVTRSLSGIDECALRGALDGGGKPIVVLGHGVDLAYPTTLGPLYNGTLKQGGLLVSEYPLHTTPALHRHVASQRIVAALARATVLVEAYEQSQSLGVARTARDLGRRVFGVPGPVTSSASCGVIDLLESGEATAARDFSRVTVDDKVQVVYVVRPEDPVEDVAVFEEEEFAEEFAATYADIGPVECATVRTRALAARLIAERHDEGNEANDRAPDTDAASVLRTYTVAGVYDNLEPYNTKVRATSREEAIALAKARCRRAHGGEANEPLFGIQVID